MEYTPEETGFLIGLFSTYFSYPSVSASVKEKYLSVCERLSSGAVTQQDKFSIKQALQFLEPTRRESPEDYRMMMSVLFKTTADQSNS